MSKHYILDGKTPREAELLEWARWYETAERHVAVDTLDGGVRVSTVFLGLNHQYGDGPPLIFETLIFGGPMGQDMWRYSTWQEAEEGHRAAVGLAQAAGVSV